jgi:hypothetical protein
MRLDVDYKLWSKLIFGQNYDNFSFAIPFLDFDSIFLSGVFFKVAPGRIYALCDFHWRRKACRRAAAASE